MRSRTVNGRRVEFMLWPGTTSSYQQDGCAQPATQGCVRTDSLLREVGLHLAVATMRRGERCRLHVAPQYAFGERGSFSFPSVPPNANVEYEVNSLKHPRAWLYVLKCDNCHLPGAQDTSLGYCRRVRHCLSLDPHHLAVTTACAPWIHHSQNWSQIHGHCKLQRLHSSLIESPRRCH